ncbi:MAG: leucine-rich repeat-containing protein kinase family protein [Alcaligenaceae bacterium]
MDTVEQLRRGELAGATRLVLSEGLTEFPREIIALADTLEYLDLSGNALTSLPDDFARLGRLQVLFCAGNRFTELPVVLGQCQSLSMIGFRSNQISTFRGAALPPQLRWLILMGNQLSALPPEIGACTELQKVALAGNLLSTLPDEMAKCTKLELLRIAANRFEVLPEWLLRMPRLSWLGYAGNPVCATAEARALSGVTSAPSLRTQGGSTTYAVGNLATNTSSNSSMNPAIGVELNQADDLSQVALAQVPWDSLQIKQKLGEGASGVIYQAGFGDGPQDVAVKVFKGALTSDGLPNSEIAAYLSAGSHPYLINLLGKVIDHPEGTQALVMQLVDPSYRNLARPPSLQSCTRDVYASDLRFSLHDALRLACGVASLARQLHSRGLTHGDLYAHNTLIGVDGHAVLGDFGAAAFYDQSDQVVAQALEQIEVRAFGCLFEELLERVALAVGSTLQRSAALQAALALCEACLVSQVSQRPFFKQIEAQLATLIRVD